MYLVLERTLPALSTYFEFTIRFKNKQIKYPNTTVHPEAFVASCPGKSQSCSSVGNSWQVWWLCVPHRLFWSWQKWTQLAVSKVCRKIPWNTQQYWQNSYLVPDTKASDCSGHSSTLHHAKHRATACVSQFYRILLIFKIFKLNKT